jgi:ACS family D-galactonate transporter-like MFS transporter
MRSNYDTSAANSASRFSVDISNRQRWSIVALLFSASMLNYIDRATISFALPLISQDLHLDPTGKGVLLSAFFWSYAFMQIPIGWAADRVNLKWLYAGMFTLWSLACGLAGTAGSLGVLIVLRVLLGFGESIYLPGGMTVVSRLFAPKERGLPSGMFDFGTRSGLVLDGILLPWLIITYGWRNMFYIVGFTALVWMLPWLLTFPSRLPASQGGAPKPDPRKAPLESAAVLAFPIILLIAPILVPLQIRFPNALGGPNRPGPIGAIHRFLILLRNRNLYGIVLGFFCFDYYWYMMLNWLPDYLKTARGLAIREYGIFAAITFFIFGITEPLGGWLADRLIQRGWDETRTRKGIVTVGFLTGLMVIPATMMANGGTVTLLQSIPWVYDKPVQIPVHVILIFGGAFVGLSTGNLLAILQCCAPPDQVGIWTGVKNYSGNLGGIVGPLVMGFLISRTGSYAPGFAVAAILLVLGLIPYWFIVGELKPRASAPV